MYTLTPMRIKLAFFAFVGALPLCLAADGRPAAGTYTLLQADSLTGSTAGWTVETSPSFAKRRVRLVVEGNALMANVLEGGLFICIR